MICERVNTALLIEVGSIIPPAPAVPKPRNPDPQMEPRKRFWRENCLCMLCGRKRAKQGLLCPKHKKYQRDYQQRLRDEGKVA